MSSSMDLIYNPAMLATCAPALASRCNKTLESVATSQKAPASASAAATKRASGWDAAGVRCLENHVHDADTPDVCARAVEGMLRIKHKDYRLNAALMVACAMDIATLAPEELRQLERDGSLLTDTLVDTLIKQRAKLSKPCKVYRARIELIPILTSITTTQYEGSGLVYRVICRTYRA